MTAELLAIYVSPCAETLPGAVQRVRARAGKGLEGDRYATGKGTFSDRPGRRDVTLIEAEALAEFARDYRETVHPAAARRNLVTRGVRLNELVGREFRVGGVPMRGLRLCEPCTHLARLTTAAVLPGLVHRGGLYAEILEDGEIAVEDGIEVKS